MRLPDRSAVRDRRVRVEELQRGHRNEALADRLLVGVADRPRLIEGGELPRRVGHDPADLVRKIDARRRTEPEHASVFRDRIRADPADVRRHRASAGKRVEVDIARVRETGHEIQRAVRPPVEEARTADAERARRDVDGGLACRRAL